MYGLIGDGHRARTALVPGTQASARAATTAAHSRGAMTTSNSLWHGMKG